MFKRTTFAVSVKDISQAFNRKVGGIKKPNPQCLMNVLNEVKDKLVDSFCVVHALRVGNKPKQHLGR